MHVGLHDHRVQQFVEAEPTEKIGAGRYERAAQRTVHRNGHRAKTLSTPAGDVEVKIPKLRSGSFFPVLLERRRRIEARISSTWYSELPERHPGDPRVARLLRLFGYCLLVRLRGQPQSDTGLVEERYG